MERLQEASQYEVAATYDYLSARCLLLNGVFNGQILGHEALEKLLKATICLVLPSVKIPKYGYKGHDLKILSGFLVGHHERFDFLKDGYVAELDTHYMWRYYDNFEKASKIRHTSDIHKIDRLWVQIFMEYFALLPKRSREGDFFLFNLLNHRTPLSERWSRLLLQDNVAVLPYLQEWKKELNDLLGT